MIDNSNKVNMGNNSEYKTFHLTLSIITGINLTFTLCLNVVWVFFCIRRCWNVMKQYRICKGKPNLHPIYRDVQHLSQLRNLYNIKTHFVKYCLIIVCLCVEICALAWNGFSLAMKRYLASKDGWNLTQIELPSGCKIPSILGLEYQFPFYIINYHLNIFLPLVLIFSVSILSRYLAARYLNHPFKRLFLKYFAWIAFQFILVAVCSTYYTFLFAIALFPFLSIASWLVLLRENVILNRVLKSNLRELQMHSDNKALYREQLCGYKLYRLFVTISLASTFALVVALNLLSLIRLFRIATDSYCLVNIIYGPEFDSVLHSPHLLTLRRILAVGESLTLLLYSISNCLPLICITLSPIILALVKRYRSRKYIYRYNYENIEPLMRRYNRSN